MGELAHTLALLEGGGGEVVVNMLIDRRGVVISMLLGSEGENLFFLFSVRKGGGIGFLNA